MRVQRTQHTNAKPLYVASHLAQKTIDAIKAPAYVHQWHKGLGFCETCQQHKPAPPKRAKGWKCRDCKKRQV